MLDGFGLTSAKRAATTALRKFYDEQSGGMAVATAILMIPMLTVGGAAVDFMRFEEQRVKIQDCLDHSVLAAANLASSGTVPEIQAKAMAWAAAGGCDEFVSEAPIVTSNDGARTVKMIAKEKLPTYFIKFAGIGELNLNVVSEATNGTSRTEISLILDISGSMSKSNRVENMRLAAQKFATLVLDELDGDNVALHVVPYAGQTNPGPVMFNYLNSIPAQIDIPDGMDSSEFPDISSCIEMGPEIAGGATDFSITGLPTGRPEVPTFSYWNPKANIGWGWCPPDNQAIQYGRTEAGDVNTAGTLNNWIENLQLHDGTGTHYAIKYGLALLDPDMEPAFDDLADAGLISSDLDTLPMAWEGEGTRKIIVLMTDGRITQQYRPTNPADPVNYDTALRGRAGSSYESTDSDDNVASFKAVCQAAKDNGVTVYTVAFEAPEDGEEEMGECASSASHFFKSYGEEIIDDFETIANDLTTLRLTQ